MAISVCRLQLFGCITVLHAKRYTSQHQCRSYLQLCCSQQQKLGHRTRAGTLPRESDSLSCWSSGCGHSLGQQRTGSSSVRLAWRCAECETSQVGGCRLLEDGRPPTTSRKGNKPKKGTMCFHHKKRRAGRRLFPTRKNWFRTEILVTRELRVDLAS